MRDRSFFRTPPGLATLIAGGFLLCVLIVYGVILGFHWPFTEEKIAARLAHITGSRVEAGAFRSHLIPWAGCTMENVTFTRGQDKVIARVQRLTIRTYWWTMFTFQKRASQIRADGLVVNIPAEMPPPVKDATAGKGDVTASELIADGAVVNFEAAAGEPPAVFHARRLRLANLQKGSPMDYETIVEIPNPHGTVQSSGKIGPFEADHAAETYLEGKFQLKNGDLSAYQQLSGIASGEGSFEGPLRQIHVSGTASVAGMEIDHTGHPVEVKSNYQAEVNAASGDVRLDKVKVEFRKTHLDATATISKVNKDRGKTVAANIRSQDARIEDLLWLCTKSPRPALNGPIALKADAVLPPGPESFLRRLRLQGSFQIDDARWTKPQTQTKINVLSAKASGDQEDIEEKGEGGLDRALSDMRGAVNLRGGTATLTRLSLRVPGANAAGQGKYNLLTKDVELDGKVAMAADVSDTTSGLKSFFLKPLDIFFRRHKTEKGATLPVRVRGKYPNPEFSVGLR